MPIKFRCPNCQQFLGISRSKAGSVTDCPTCGRTLRVPNLDGEVSPLPPPKLNFEDRDLQRALGALASLGPDGEPVDQSSGPDSRPGASLEAVEIENQENIPIIVAEPVLSSQPGKVAPDPISDPVAHLQEELAQIEMAIPILEPEPDRTSPTKSLILLVSGTVAGLLIGIFLGRLTAPTSPQSTEKTNENAEMAQKADVPEPVLPQGGEARPIRSGVAGTLTYQSASGETRPDKGGRILILPAQNQSQTKLPGNGFRVGAEKIDQEVLSAAVTALGGGFQLADSQGRFEINDLEPGGYLILFASRYQSLDDSQPVSPAVQKILEQYFLHPSRVVGQVQHEAMELKVTSEPSPGIDVEFGL